MVKRGEVYWVRLDPVLGTEISKTRLALVVSPDDMNRALPRVIIAPLTSKAHPLGCRPVVHFAGKEATILLDQPRSVDKSRLEKQMGIIPEEYWHDILIEMLS
jgi:mRNA interferase MazF